MRVTGRPEDRFAFRTPSLRNVLQTGPWGHAGAHSDLAAFLRDHAARGDGLRRYARAAVLPALPKTKPDWTILDDAAEVEAIAAMSGSGQTLTEDEIGRLMAFLATLSDPVALKGRMGVPERVPSGLPVDR